MRFFIKRYLKAFIYLIVVMFVFSFIQKRVEFTEEQQLLKLEHEFYPINGELKLRNGDPQKVDSVNNVIFDNINGAEENGKAEGDDVEDNIDEDDGGDDDEDDDDYNEDDSVIDPQVLKEVKEPFRDQGTDDSQTEVDEPVGTSTKKNKEELEKFFLEREQVFKERQNRIQNVCNRLGQEVSYGTVYKAPLRRLRWLNKNRLVMCFNAKVGTSSWTQYLMEAGFPGVLKNTSHWHYAAEVHLKPPYKRSSNASISLLKEYTKIILVRDPFARIVSAYLDKIARMQLASLCRFIVKKYRKENSGVNQRQPLFEEFVRFIIDQTPRNDSIREKRDHRSDRHWFHYYANCAPCDIRYDVIATMETVHEDTRYIMEKFNLGLKDTLWNNHQGKSSSEEKAINLFKALPRNLTLELYQRYRVDFLMFGYGPEKYLSP